MNNLRQYIKHLIPGILAMVPGIMPVAAQHRTEFTQMVDSTPATMELSEKLYDFGKVKVGDSYHHTFTITNTGKRDLIIESVKGCCDNVTFTQVRDPVPPGRSCSIQVIFHPGVHNLGKFKKGTYVTTNGVPRHFILQIAGEIVN